MVTPREALDIIYKPSPWQVKFHAICNPDGTMIDEILGAGAAGPGKSLCLLMNPFDKICEEHARCVDQDHPFPIRIGASEGWTLHLRRMGVTLSQTQVRAQRIFPRIDPGVRWYAGDRMWVFSSGYRYQFGHCNDRSDWEAYDSNQYDEILFDELVQFFKEQYDNIRTRLRSSDPVLSRKLRIRAMSNPNRKVEDGATVTEDPFWVRTRFVDPHQPGGVILKAYVSGQDGLPLKVTRLYLPARLSDNPDKGFRAQYGRQLAMMPEHIRKAMLDGDWYVVAGSYWGDVWNSRFHVCRPFKIPKGWKRFRSMDWGYKKHGCVGWYAMDEEGNLYKTREYTFIKTKVADVAKEIRAIEIDMGLWSKERDRSLIVGPADDQLWEERGDEIAVTKAQVMQMSGVPWVKADKRSRTRNATLLHERLGDHDGGTSQPGIVFFNTCHNTTMRIPVVPTDPKDQETPLDTGDDHWVDETMYACAYASTEVRVSHVRRDEDDGRVREVAPSRGRSYGYGQVV